MELRNAFLLTIVPTHHPSFEALWLPLKTI